MGVGAVFAASPRLYMYYRSGSLKFLEWLCLGSAGLGGYVVGN